MPQLLVLPNEVLLQVIGDLSHGGLENFALTCKQILSLSHDAINEKKNTYSTIDSGDMFANDHVKGLRLFTVLRDILLDDSIAVYTTKIVIGDDSVRDSSMFSQPPFGKTWSQSRPAVHQILLEMENEIALALNACSYLNHDRAFFQKKIMTGDKDSVEVAIALLVTLLPSLHCIETRNCFSDFHRFLDRIFRSIGASHSNMAESQDWDNETESSQQKNEEKGSSIKSDMANMATSAKTQIPALSKIREVKILRTESFLVSPVEIKMTSLSFSSIQPRSGNNIVGYRRYLDASTSWCSTEGRTTKICIGDNVTHVRTLQDLLMNIISPENYSYTSPIFCHHTWEPRDINQSLPNSLSLISPGHTEDDVANATTDCTSLERYLKEYQVLREVRLDNFTLTKDHLRLRDILAAWTPWYDVSSSIESLPVTVTHLALTGPFSKGVGGVGREFLEKLPGLKRNGLSGLKVVTFSREPLLGGDLEDALEDAGIELRLGIWGMSVREERIRRGQAGDTG